MMTEREAWYYLAQAFEQAQPDTLVDGIYCAIILGHRESCICWAIAQMRGCGSISGLTSISMQDRMDDYALGHNLDNNSFWWPRRTKEGTAARAEFCAKMARQCTDEGVE